MKSRRSFPCFSCIPHSLLVPPSNSTKNAHSLTHSLFVVNLSHKRNLFSYLHWTKKTLKPSEFMLLASRPTNQKKKKEEKKQPFNREDKRGIRNNNCNESLFAEICFLGAWASDTNISIRKLGYFFGAQEICAQRITLFLRTLILKETNKSPLYLCYLKKNQIFDKRKKANW